MTVRHRRKCTNCPEAPKATVNTAGRAVSQEATVLTITGPTEGQRLWRHIVIGTGTCISMMEQYAIVNMPGNPLRELEDFQVRIGQLINKYKVNPDEGDAPAERVPLANSVDGQIGLVGDDADTGRLAQDDGTDAPAGSE